MATCRFPCAPQVKSIRKRDISIPFYRDGEKDELVNRISVFQFRFRIIHQLLEARRCIKLYKLYAELSFKYCISPLAAMQILQELESIGEIEINYENLQIHFLGYRH